MKFTPNSTTEDIVQGMSYAQHLAVLHLSVAMAASQHGEKIAEAPEAFTAGVAFALLTLDGLKASGMDLSEVDGSEVARVINGSASVIFTAKNLNYPVPDATVRYGQSMVGPLISDYARVLTDPDSVAADVSLLAAPDVIMMLAREDRGAPEPQTHYARAARDEVSEIADQLRVIFGG